jgi:hypothetical protein
VPNPPDIAGFTVTQELPADAARPFPRLTEEETLAKLAAFRDQLIKAIERLADA